MKAKLSLYTCVLLVAGCSGPIQTEAPAPERPSIVSERNAPLKPRRSPLGVGDRFPVFELADQNSIPVTHAEIASGKGAVIVFMPPDGAPGARPVFDWARKQKSFLRQQGLELLLITPAPPSQNAITATREDLRIAVLSDPASWVARAYGVVGEGEPHPLRANVFLLGPNGLIQYASASLPSAAELVTAAETTPGEPKSAFFSF